MSYTYNRIENDSFETIVWLLVTVESQNYPKLEISDLVCLKGSCQISPTLGHLLST